MHIHTRSVNTAFRTLVEGIHTGQIPTSKKPSRNGNVLQVEDPITITYTHPKERVLFNQARDCNPSFHLYESLYMISGGNKIAPLAYYAKKMADFSDDGVTQNGAYGYRWRTSHVNHRGYPMKNSEVDQLDILVAHLKADPNSRRAVLQMWNVEDDLLKLDNGKDLCCNLSVMFSLRPSPDYVSDDGGPSLDMTVTNRSNDLIWGLLGANFVHFSFLQEYMAARLGVEVGKYHHFSNNLHLYTDTNSGFHAEKWLSDKTVDLYQIPHTPLETVALVKDPSAFDREVQSIVEIYKDDLHPSKESTTYFSEPFLMEVAQPAFQAFGCHKAKLPTRAMEWASSIKDEAWRTACTSWLQRRIK